MSFLIKQKKEIAQAHADHDTDADQQALTVLLTATELDGRESVRVVSGEQAEGRMGSRV